MQFGLHLASIVPYLNTAEQIDASFYKIAKMGYNCVQLHGIPIDVPDNRIAQALKNNGLTCIATQEDYPFWFKNMPERAIERAVYCDAKYLSFSMVPPTVNTYDKLKRFSGTIAKIRDLVCDAHLVFTYHPAEIDFRPIGKQPVFDRLMALLPNDIQLSLCVHDAFGKMPYTQILEKYIGRVDLVQFRDSITRADGAEQLMPLGEGDHNWQPILNACVQSGAKYGFVKQENWDRDAFSCAESSLRYLQNLQAE